MPLQSIEPRRLYRQIAEQIRTLIEGGEYRVGSRLPPERDLARQMRVSRPSVREALIALEVEGLVEVRIGSGIYVRRTGAEARAPASVADSGIGPFELIRARRVIEGECAALAAQHARRPQVGAMREALARMEADAGASKPPLEADRLFHLRIAEATGNAALVAVVRSLWEERAGPLFSQLEHHFDTPRLWAAALREHRAILDAIAAGDVEAARAGMHRHMDQATKRFSKGWSENA
jgi:GntR family transcriptional repressor for pyruvate dehydrogenase complex